MATGVSRLNGQFATASYLVSSGSFTGIVNLFEWEVTVTTELADVTAHGDYWKTNVVLRQSWTARARGYFTSGGVASYLNQWAIGSGGAYTDPVATYFTGYNVATGQNAGNIIFQGQGFVTRGNISVPMAIVEQEFEVEGSGSPLVLG